MTTSVEPFEAINRQTYGQRDNVLKYTFDKLTPPERVILDKYKSELAGKTLLDIGCGYGRTSAFLKDLVGDYTGVDYSSAAIEVCKERFPGVRFLHCDARRLDPFADGQFDAVVFPCNGIDAMDRAGRSAALSEIARVTKKGGLFILASHNNNYLTQTWHGKVPFPTLKFSKRPKQFIKRVKDYVKSVSNYLRHRRLQWYGEHESMVLGVAFNYGLMTYYIDKDQQRSDLSEVGFEVEKMYDKEGLEVRAQGNDGHSPWVFYVSRKNATDPS